MQAVRTQMAWFVPVALFLGTMVPTVSPAQVVQPAEVLKGQDLKRSSGATWIVAGEAAILKKARETRALSIQLRSAQLQQQALETGNQNPQVVIDNYRQQLEWVNQRITAYDNELAKVGPPGGNLAAAGYYNVLVQERNGIVGEQRRLVAVINNLNNQRGEYQELKGQFNTEVARLRESYMQGAEDLRKSVDAITAKYTELAGKPEVSKALKDLSTSTKIPQKLGPSKELAAAIKWLAKLETTVQSETVELHRENGIGHIDVMINGKGPFRMVFDTGAGPTTLPAGIASQLGLKPTGRTITLVVADGSKVAAREMVLGTVRIGRLTVKDVTCVVMPEEKGDIAPLLGQSILERFDFKYTQGSGRLVLTKVEPDEPAATPAKAKAATKKRGGR
jgi:clan AA aspartic protease (TIGR02281 family)